ncbi:MAG: DsbA family protein [Solirubrobacteraceae bacterium]
MSERSRLSIELVGEDRPAAEPDAGPIPTFCFDLRSPLCYLAAEQVLHRFAGALAWRPVDLTLLPAAERFEAFRCEQEIDAFRESVQARAARLRLQPLRWPRPFPFDATLAMRAAAYAQSIGRGAAFALAAFRQAFAGGHALEREDFVLIAAAACEMHPTAVRAAIASRATARRLERSSEEALAAGAVDLPAFLIDGEALIGEHELERAARLLQRDAPR